MLLSLSNQIRELERERRLENMRRERRRYIFIVVELQQLMNQGNLFQAFSKLGRSAENDERKITSPRFSPIFSLAVFRAGLHPS